MLLATGNPEAKFVASQLALSWLPATHFIENYLDDNQGGVQSLDEFPMMRQIYDTIPQRLLLKCSRKTLKSTLLSNFICLNMIRWKYYSMLYVGPQETSVKYFSQNYVNPRFDSRRVKSLFAGSKMWRKNDVFEKILNRSLSACIFRYCSDDATRLRGPAVDQITYDEVQDIDEQTFSVIEECFRMSKYKRLIYAGTPLTTDNTIEKLWKQSNQLEWMTKCPCGHWNGLVIENEPLKMLTPAGYCCPKCSRKINTREGEWVTYNPDAKRIDGKTALVGYHLAQPMLPHYNETQKEWNEFYLTVTKPNRSVAAIYNENLGISYDVGAKFITEQELRRICTLGPMFEMKGDKRVLKVMENNRRTYMAYTGGADWGVSGITSRTAACFLAVKENGNIDCVYAKVWHDFEYKDQIKEIARISKDLRAKMACDSGPDPQRGIELGRLIGSSNINLVRYNRGKLIQAWDSPNGAIDWTQNRWLLHRSDCFNIVGRWLKSGRLRFPQWEDMSDIMQDILNVYVEVKDVSERQEMYFRKKSGRTDDFAHALLYALASMLSEMNDPCLNAPSSEVDDFAGDPTD